MITSRTHTAPRIGLPHIYFDEVPYSMAISYTLELTPLRTDGSHVAHIQEYLHRDFVRFFKVPPNWYTGNVTAPPFYHETHTPL